MFLDLYIILSSQNVWSQHDRYKSYDPGIGKEVFTII